MHEDILSRAASHEAITEEEASLVIGSLKGGEMSEDDVSSFADALFSKASPVESVGAFVRAMRTASGMQIAPTTEEDLVEVCGTGGAISLPSSSVAAAIVAAAGGAKVVMHMIPDQPGKISDADLLKGLGINIEITAEQAAEMIDKVGCAFISVDSLKPVIDSFLAKASEDARVFFHTVIAPLIDPAAPKRCFIGTADQELQEVITNVAKEAGCVNGMIVCGLDGVDEISMIGTTHVSELASGRVVNWDTTPDENGIDRCAADDIKTGSVKEAVYALKSVLSGKLQGPRREAIVLNGAAALMSGGKAGYFARGIMTVRNMLDDGTVAAKLEEIKKISSGFAK